MHGSTPLRSRVVRLSQSVTVSSIASWTKITSYSEDIILVGLSMPPTMIRDPFAYRYCGGSAVLPPYQTTRPEDSASFATCSRNVTSPVEVRLSRVLRTIRPRAPGYLSIRACNFSSAARDLPVPAGPDSSTSVALLRHASAAAPYAAYRCWRGVEGSRTAVTGAGARIGTPGHGSTRHGRCSGSRTPRTGPSWHRPRHTPPPTSGRRAHGRR